MLLFSLSTNMYLRSVCVTQLHECTNFCLLWSDVVNYFLGQWVIYLWNWCSNVITFYIKIIYVTLKGTVHNNGSNLLLSAACVTVVVVYVFVLDVTPTIVFAFYPHNAILFRFLLWCIFLHFLLCSYVWICVHLCGVKHLLQWWKILFGLLPNMMHDCTTLSSTTASHCQHWLVQALSSPVIRLRHVMGPPHLNHP